MLQTVRERSVKMYAVHLHCTLALVGLRRHFFMIFLTEIKCLDSRARNVVMALKRDRDVAKIGSVHYFRVVCCIDTNSDSTISAHRAVGRGQRRIDAPPAERRRDPHPERRRRRGRPPLLLQLRRQHRCGGRRRRRREQPGQQRGERRHGGTQRSRRRSYQGVAGML